MNKFRFLLDENVDPILRRALHRDAPKMTVWRVGDPVAPRFGTSDPEILDWCAINGFALVTNNRSSMPRHLQEHMGQGKEAPAIFVLRPDLSMEQTVGELHLIWAASEPHEFINIIWYLPLFS